MMSPLERVIVSIWVNELSAKLGRSPRSILERGLNAGDFSIRNTVEIKFDDGSSASFRCAFFVRSQEANRVTVFTEHCGYHEFHAGGLEIQDVEIA
jgi:hypothetical protein